VDIVDSPNRFEEYFSNYTNVEFVLAHCKESATIIELFKKYPNVYGDTAFCPEESYNIICEMGFKNRLQYGTDFPIMCIDNKSEKNLNSSYKKIKRTLEKLVSKV
jgi:predicted TIM-barrel fold metal-dependent hydrolase